MYEGNSEFLGREEVFGYFITRKEIDKKGVRGRGKNIILLVNELGKGGKR